MRTITVSTDVFAEIWRRRQEGEESEESILRRVLEVQDSAARIERSEQPRQPSGDGFHDARSGVQFQEGFEIFRIYKGAEYRAVATRGAWLLKNTNERFPSLHKLSTSIMGTVNAWQNWYFLNEEGQQTLIDRLRSEVGAS